MMLAEVALDALKTVEISTEKVQVTLADFALDALKKHTWLLHASVWRLAAFRKTVDLFARSKDLSRRSRPTHAALGFT